MFWYLSETKDVKVIDLRRCVVMEANENNRRSKRDTGPLCGFNVHTETKIITFNTDSVEEGERWAALLEEWRLYFRQQSRPDR